MQTFNLELPVKEFFIKPGRTRMTLILIKTSDNKFALGTKITYLPNIARMIGGGIEEGEDPELATLRELKEETNLDVELDKLQELCTIESVFKKGDQTENLTTYVYLYNLGNKNLTAGDDVNGFAYFTAEELKQLVSKLQNLDGTYPALYKKEETMLWKDWGTFHGFVLQKAIDSLIRSN